MRSKKMKISALCLAVGLFIAGCGSSNKAQKTYPGNPQYQPQQQDNRNKNNNTIQKNQRGMQQNKPRTNTNTNRNTQTMPPARK